MQDHLPLQSLTDFGSLIQSRRKALGLSQNDLASLTGVAQSNLSKIERGLIPATLETYLRLASALGIDFYGSFRS